MADSASVETAIRDFLRRSNKPSESLEPGMSLFADGLGLDSLAAAELSAVLEDELGTDPFSAGQMPETVGDIFDFYAADADPQTPAAAG